MHKLDQALLDASLRNFSIVYDAWSLLVALISAFPSVDGARVLQVLCFASALGRQGETTFQHGGITAQEYAALNLSERGTKLLGYAKPQLPRM